jgi:hypothetical protein
LKVSTGVGGHGVIGLLEGKRDGPIVAWRADLDAVPGDEILDTPYKSCVPSVVYICGHDAHITVGLGIAQVLSSMWDQAAGQVKFIFQPAEETVVGARAIIDVGGSENPRPSAIFALHIAPYKKTSAWRSSARTLLDMRETCENSTKEERMDLVHIMIQEVGVDMEAKCILWVRARPDYEPLFSILDSLRLDGEKRYWIEPSEPEGDISDIEADNGQMSTGVEILLPMSYNT